MKYYIVTATLVALSTGCFAYSSADFDYDSYVDISDVIIFSSQWLCEPNSIDPNSGDPNSFSIADFDSSGTVDFIDYAYFAAQWNPYPWVTIAGMTNMFGVVMQGLPGDPVTDVDGSYSVLVPHGWNGTVTPYLARYDFMPSSRQYHHVTNNLLYEDYGAVLNSYVISGCTGVDGVTMVGLPGNPVTSGGGYYSVVVPYGWSDMVTPTLAGYSFTPTQKQYGFVTGNLLAENYAFLKPTTEDCVQWLLDDNSNSAIVGGSEVNGQVYDGGYNYTSTVSATINGIRAFHFNGYDQYVRVTIPKIWPSALANMWDKYPGNPVLYANNGINIKYGQIIKNPAGGYYWFGSSATNNLGDNIYRWSSNDLINWTDKTLMLPSGGPGAWDKYCQVASAICKPDGTWAMLYRGFDGYYSYHIGKAVSNDGTNWSRVGDGPSTQFANNFDPVGIMLVGDTYYVWANGDYGHGIQNLYTSKDFETFTRYPRSPIFSYLVPYDFCASPWYYGGYYYLLVAQDFTSASSSTLYDHALALYRSPIPTFDSNNREFLGYPIVNDQNYDAYYLDTPSVPVMDVSRTYSSEFGNTLYCLYDGHGGHAPYGNTQNLAYTTLDKLAALKPKIKNLRYDQKITYTFWVSFDSLSSSPAVFSIGGSAGDSSPVELCKVRTKGSAHVLSLYVNGTYVLGNTALQVNKPYHVVVVDASEYRMVYVNGVYDGLTTTLHGAGNDATYLYIGEGYGNSLPGYVWDFRIYPKTLADPEIERLYKTGTIVDPNAGNIIDPNAPR